VSPTDLEAALRDLTTVGTLVKDRGYRQVWRFAFGGRSYYLKFYPRHGWRDWLRRRFRGSPALREFDRLQRLQRADVPAPRAVACLAGFRVADRPGDAVILHAIEPSVQLDDYLNDHELRAQPVPGHLDLARQVRELVRKLGQAKLGHDDLHLGNFLLSEGTVYLLDAYAVRVGGLTLRDALRLAQSAGRFGTRADLLRGWRLLMSSDATPPTQNGVAERIFNNFIQRTKGDGRFFGALTAGGWGLTFFQYARYPKRWSRASRLRFTRDDWAKAWPAILARVERDGFDVIKRSRSGDVLGGEIEVGGRVLPVIVKRPKRKYWYRYVNEIGRGARARRAWFKAWNLVIRNIPTAWPLMFAERRTLGYVTDTLIVFERVEGPTLADADLDAIPAARRDALFRRAGRALRQIERHGFSHFDAKSSNWIVMPDDVRGETPVLVDPDGIRRRRWVALGIERLLRSMRHHEQYTPADSLALCQGYAPWSRFEREGGEETNDQAPIDQGPTAKPQ
jgi:tRNA A-37 threonylcarbamoyl transferase component Bud32